MIYARVAGWENPRAILEENGKILFEVALTGHCSTCQSRIDHVRETVARKNISAEFRAMPTRFSECGLYVVLDPPAKGVDVRRHVGELLNLAIS